MFIIRENKQTLDFPDVIGSIYSRSGLVGNRATNKLSLIAWGLKF